MTLSQKNILFFISVILLLFVSFFFFTEVSAQNLSAEISNQLNSGAKGAEIGTAIDPRVFIAQMIKFVLTLIGTFFMILIIMGGYWYLTDHGEGVKIEKAQKTIKNAILGLLLVLTAYSITIMVSRTLLLSSQGKDYQPQGIRANCSFVKPGGFLGFLKKPQCEYDSY